MSQQVNNEAAPGRSFFQRPAFWMGAVLWVGVAIAAGFVMNRKSPTPGGKTIANSEQSNDSAVAPSANSSETPAESQPQQIRITTDKDGNTKILRPGEDPESPWDKDGIADFEFIDTEGKTVTKADLLGKPWICCFVFTHCALTCPAVTNSMREQQDQLKDYDFRLVTLTVDPVRDTPEVLKEYGKSRGADFSKWMFLGGEQRDIYKLIHGSFKMPVVELLGEKRKTGFEFIHSNNVMLVDETGVVRGKYDATKGAAMADLRREIQKMAKKKTNAPAATEPTQPDKPTE